MAIKRVSDLVKYELSSQNNKLNLNDLLEVETYDSSNQGQYISKKLTYGELLSSLLLEFGEMMSKRAGTVDEGPEIKDTDPLVTYKRLPSPFPLGTLFHTTIPYEAVSATMIKKVKISTTLPNGATLKSNALSSIGSYLPADGGVVCSLSTYQQYIISSAVSAYVDDAYIMSDVEFNDLYAQLSSPGCDNENSIFYTISAMPYDNSRRIRDMYRPIYGYVRNRFYAYWRNWRWGWGGWGYGGWGYPYYNRAYYNNYWWLWYHRPWARRLPHWHPMRRIFESRLSAGQELFSQSMLHRSDGTGENPLNDIANAKDVYELTDKEYKELAGFSGAAPKELVYLPTLKNIYIENTDEVSADHTYDVPTLPNVTGRIHTMTPCGVAEGAFQSQLAHIERYHAYGNTIGVANITIDASRNSSTYDLSNLGEVKPFSVKLVPYVLIKTQPAEYVVTKINFAKMNPFVNA